MMAMGGGKTVEVSQLQTLKCRDGFWASGAVASSTRQVGLGVAEQFSDCQPSSDNTRGGACGDGVME